MPALLARAEVLSINIIKLEALGSTRKLAARTIDNAFNHAILLLDNRFRRRGNRCSGAILGYGIDTRSNSLLVNKRSNAIMDQNNGVLIRYTKTIKLGQAIKDGILTRLAAWNNRKYFLVMGFVNDLAHVLHARLNAYDNNAIYHAVLLKMINGMRDNGLSAEFEKLLGNSSPTHP